MPTLVKEAVELSLMSLSKANVQSQANYSDLLLMVSLCIVQLNTH